MGDGEREEWKLNGGGELVQSTLYACIELPQWNSLVLLVYDNSKIKLRTGKKKNTGWKWPIIIILWDEEHRFASFSLVMINPTAPSEQ
jgi:hypothetical protein